MSVVVDPMQYNTLSNFSDFNRITLFTGFRQAISISFFFVSGLPPFLLFVYKYIMLTQITISNYFLVVIFMIILNAIALVYYLRIIKAMLFEEKNAVSVTATEYIVDDMKKNYNDTYNITLDFILYLFFAVYISAYLFLYIDEIQNYLNGNSSENYLNLFYTLKY
jgi:NADH:ubiquinone oxidoreductase subunit 2 (subunit N)